MKEVMQEQTEQVHDPAILALEDAARQADIDTVRGLVKEAEAEDPGSPRHAALEAVNYRLFLREVVYNAKTNMEPVTAAKPPVPDESHIPTLSDELAKAIAGQHDVFESATQNYLEDLRLGFQIARAKNASDPFEKVKVALDDDASRAVVLGLLTELSAADKDDLVEVGGMIRDNVSRELWEALQAGRETTNALLHGDRSETAVRLVNMWKKELDDAIDLTPEQVTKAIKWLEKNEE